MKRVFFPALILLAACSGEQPPAEPTEDATAAAEAGPEAVIQAYYDAISSRDFDTAWQLWGQDPQADPDAFQTFMAGFAETELTAVNIGEVSAPRVSDGAATVTVAVEVDDLLSDGSGRSYDGVYTLRRAVDDTGDWHIVSGDLDIVPARK